MKASKALKTIKQINLFNKLYNKPFNEEILNQVANEADKDKNIEVSGILYNRVNLRQLIDNYLSMLDISYNYNDIELWSEKIYVLDETSVDLLIEGYIGDNKTYIKDQYKCGHFSVDFLDYVSDVTRGNQLFSNLGLGIFAFSWRDESGKKYGHALNWILESKNGEVYLRLVEPQSGKKYPVENYFNYRKLDGDSEFRLILFLML